MHRASIFENVAAQLVNDQMKGTYKFLGLLAINTLIATNLSAVAVTPIRRALMHSSLAPNTVPGFIALNVTAGFLIAFAIGLCLWIKFPMEPAKWTWVVAAVILLIEFYLFRSERNVLDSESFQEYALGLGPSDASGRAFAGFTFPMLNAIAYSLGAWTGALIMARSNRRPSGEVASESHSSQTTA